MLEKRIYRMADIELNGQYLIDGIDREFKKASVINISAEGFCFAIDEKLENGTRIKLNVVLDEKEIVRLNVEVKWTKRDDSTGKCVVGAHIIEEIDTHFEKFLIFYCKQASKSSEKD